MKQGMVSSQHPQIERSPTTEVVGIRDYASIKESGELQVFDSPEKEARYLSRKELGKGGMGVVELCLDQHLGRHIARKTLSPRWRFNDDKTRRFLREIQIQSQLEHPSIVPVFDYSTNAQGDIFFTMRRIRGTTLLEAMQNLSSQTVPEEQRKQRNRLLHAFLQICLTIEYAHYHGVLHRDIKPTNLMLGNFGEVYVLDWGVAKVLSEKEDLVTPESSLQLTPVIERETWHQIRLGTPNYMSPEQYKNSAEITAQSEVYALGLILFEILTGHSVKRSSAAHNFTWPAPSNLRPSALFPEYELPAEFDVICQKACSFETKDRFASVRELHDAVEAVLQGDRDRKLRKELSKNHLQSAIAVHESVPPKQWASETLQHAGKALALDPTNKQAQDLVAECLLTPISEIPTGLAEIQKGEEVRDSSRGMYGNASVTFALLIAAGIVYSTLEFQDFLLFLGAVVPMGIGFLFLVFNNPGSDKNFENFFRSIACGVLFACPVFFSSFAYGPFVIPPLLCCIVCVLTVSVVDLGWRRMLIILFSFSALLGVFALYSFHGDLLGFYVSKETITISSNMFYFGKGTLLPGVVVFFFLISVLCLAVWVNLSKLVESRRRVLQFEWKLRQLASIPNQKKE